MLSYRHAFHAGNYADVLKHMVWQQVLLHLNRKDKPYCVIDTHAGAGLYSLTSAEAQKTAEFEQGVGRLWQPNPPALVAEYLAALAELNGGQGEPLRQYPGSPWFSLQALRPTDRAWFCELHPQDFSLLRQTLSQGGAHPRRVRALKADGFVELIAKLPPTEKRGAVLIDPSYERKQDYQTVIEVLIKAHKRFATGSYVLWYPVVERRRIKQMARQLVDSGIANIHQYEVGIRADASRDAVGQGMTASGVFAINPPWTLAAQLQDTLPWLAQSFAAKQGHWLVEELVPE